MACMTPLHRFPLFGIIVQATWALALAGPCSAQPAGSAPPAARSLRVELAAQEHNAVKTSWPGIGCWFWTTEEFKPEGYKRFLDLHEKHSGYALLTTSIRHPVEVTDRAVHDQIKRAADYARGRGMSIVMDLDVRLARQAFMDKHPRDMQEIVRLREGPLKADGPVELRVEAINLGDHYTFRARPYESIAGRLLRVYSYVSGPRGIDPATVQDITARCQVVQADAKAVRVALPAAGGAGPAAGPPLPRTACVLAAFTLFTPDAFSPHLIPFERAILQQYADCGLAGACKDEWGFPGRFGPRVDDVYFSGALAQAYAARRPGRDLVRDLLLMVKPHRGLEGERAAAINHYMEMNWQRQAEVENGFYRSIKEVLGPQAMSATHPTWYAFACREEVFKNAFHWWACRRDLAQTDEGAPFCARTALTKKWHSPLWVNMYYDSKIASYHEDLWRHALGGGRINFHPLYPRPIDRDLVTSLLADRLLAAEARVRLLNFISASSVDCPVAVIFGHPAAVNFAWPTCADVGLELTNRLWAEGYYADLIPSSEIASGALTLSDGCIRYGPQRYAAAVLYQPQYERAAVAEFFRKAAREPAADKTALYRVGDWTMDFDGQAFDAASALPASMKPTDIAACAKAIIESLRAAGVEPQTLSTMRRGAGFPPSMMPRPSGLCRLIDGTVILASGEKDVCGDPIARTIQVRRAGAGEDKSDQVAFDAIGVAAVRLDAHGKPLAMAAGGLKSFSCGDLKIELDARVDLAMWRDARGQWQGVIQANISDPASLAGPAAGQPPVLPDALRRLTPNWTRLRVPVPMSQGQDR